ncbi:MAG: endonuclease domain-containing protein [Burkholderiales bacterium]|nr:MAG: endonuclease domain-containing protein [Burkholderiales bacterium]
MLIPEPSPSRGGQGGDGVREQMLGQTNGSAKKFSASLRRQPTDAERLLWQRLRGEQLGAKFRRQHPYLGYVLDFVCLERKLVIEVDGSQHAESETDEKRDRDLRASGFRVLRFWNNEVITQTDAVLERIAGELQRSD